MVLFAFFQQILQIYIFNDLQILLYVSLFLIVFGGLALLVVKLLENIFSKDI